MESRFIKWLSVVLSLAAGALLIRLWMLSSSYSTTSTLFRRSYFLIDVLLGTVTVLQAGRASAGSPGRISKLALGIGIFILLVGVGMAYAWISGK